MLKCQHSEPRSHLRQQFRNALLRIALPSLLSAACFYQLRSLQFIRTNVSNISDRAAFTAQVLPGFIQQTPDAPKLKAFRQHFARMIQRSDDPTAMIVAIQHWVRRQEGDQQFYLARGPYIDGTKDPQSYLDAQRLGRRSACRRFAYILCRALLSVGMNARVVSVANSLERSTKLSHNLVEVWIEKQHKWILVDPTFDAFVQVNGEPASLIEVHDAAQLGPASRITFDQHGWQYRLPPLAEYQSYFRHIYVAKTNAVFDGYSYGSVGATRIEFAHYAGTGIEPYPQLRKELLLVGFAATAGLAVFLALRVIVGAAFRVWSKAQSRLGDNSGIAAPRCRRLLATFQVTTSPAVGLFRARTPTIEARTSLRVADIAFARRRQWLTARYVKPKLARIIETGLHRSTAGKSP